MSARRSFSTSTMFSRLPTPPETGRRLLAAAQRVPADVFALPSDNENFGIAVLEAVLAGTPVVISDEVYLADDLGQGITVCPPDPTAFAPSAIKAECRVRPASDRQRHPVIP